MRIEADRWYPEYDLIAIGIEETVLSKAIRDQELACRKFSKGARLFLGKDLLAWFEKHRVGPKEVPA